MCVFVCAVEPMFSAMCDCQALHPDPDDADTDDDDYEGEEYDVEEAGEHASSAVFSRSLRVQDNILNPLKQTFLVQKLL